MAEIGTKLAFAASDFDRFLEALRAQGYTTIAPTVRDGAIIYDEIASSADLPRGWTDSQKPGTYRLERRDDAALFGYAVGPHSWKKYLHPSRLTLWRAERQGDRFAIADDKTDIPKLAFIGVRSCELHAIGIFDTVLTKSGQVDTHFATRRRNALLVAVQCAVAGGNCFCASMHTGPRADSGFDLALTELLNAGRHEFLLEIGTEAGAEVVRGLGFGAALPQQIETAEAVVANTAAHMGKSFDNHGVRELLQRNLEHPRWEQVAQRCLGCTNCTMVCPTCFCTNVEDVTDLTGAHAERTRVWDSCFNVGFSYINGGNVRASLPARYRQWLTHKLSTWFDQFGTSGCVGCGRCITWCPVGIDITEEVAAIRATDRGPAAGAEVLEDPR
jgi:ferredoxin